MKFLYKSSLILGFFVFVCSLSANKKLPIGLQNFSQLIKDDYLYVDKTEDLYRLIQCSTPYFLTRPRRFGKSLTLSTINEIFLGKKELFKDLWIGKSDYQWPVHPVIFLDFSNIAHGSVADLHKNLNERLREIGRINNVVVECYDAPEQTLYALVNQLAKINSVVLLIDEYDKPLLDALHDLKRAKEFRRSLKSFYETVKSLGQHFRFVLLAGVSKFSKTSIFSGLNNLLDISLDPHYATVVGYTDKEIDAHFSQYLKQSSDALGVLPHQLKEKLAEWYGGYRFYGDVLKSEKYAAQVVYNPFSLLNFFKSNRFKNYWFNTGTPTFLMDLIRKSDYPIIELDAVRANDRDLDAINIKRIKLKTLLFQTGYLTIHDFDSELQHYILGFPNKEVRHSFLECVLEELTAIESTQFQELEHQIKKALLRGDIEMFVSALRKVLVQIPYYLHCNLEKFYQAIFFIICRHAGFHIITEDATSIGRIDATIETNNRVYIFEFKKDSTGAVALQQIKDRKYYEKFLPLNKEIVMVGISFDTKMHNVSDDWKVEVLET